MDSYPGQELYFLLTLIPPIQLHLPVSFPPPAGHVDQTSLTILSRRHSFLLVRLLPALHPCNLTHPNIGHLHNKDMYILGGLIKLDDDQTNQIPELVLMSPHRPLTLFPKYHVHLFAFPLYSSISWPVLLLLPVLVKSHFSNTLLVGTVPASTFQLCETYFSLVLQFPSKESSPPLSSFGIVPQGNYCELCLGHNCSSNNQPLFSVASLILSPASPTPAWLT